MIFKKNYCRSLSSCAALIAIAVLASQLGCSAARQKVVSHGASPSNTKSQQLSSHVAQTKTVNKSSQQIGTEQKISDTKHGVQQASATEQVEVVDTNGMLADRVSNQPPGEEISIGHVGVLDRLADSPISLSDSIAIALDHNPLIRVVQYGVDATAPQITAEAAEFDWQFGIELGGGQEKRQLTNILDSFGDPVTDQRLDFLEGPTGNEFYFRKQTKYGGEIEFGYNSDYERFQNVGPQNLVNPVWDSYATLRVEQPLLQGRRRRINEAPIRIARAVYSEAAALQQETLNQLILDVSIAYWESVNRTSQVGTLKTAVEYASRRREQETERYDLGAGSKPVVAEATEQYFRLLSQLKVAEVESKRARIQLAQTLGLSGEVDTIPNAVPRIGNQVGVPDFESAKAYAMAQPLVQAQRAAIKQAQYNVELAADRLRPDIRVQVDYAVRGLDEDLGRAFSTMSDFEFNDWYAGVTYEMPLGNRAAYANLRSAKRLLCREQAELSQIQNEIVSRLLDAQSRLEASEGLLEVAKERVQAAEETLDALAELYKAGRVSLNPLIDAEARLVDAQLAEIDAKIEYEINVSRWFNAQGRLFEAWVQYDGDNGMVNAN